MRMKTWFEIAVVLLAVPLVASACGPLVSAEGTDSTTGDSIKTAPLTPVTIVTEPVSGSPSRLIELTSEVALPEAGAAMVYKVNRPVVTKDVLIKVAAELGVESSDVGETREYLFLRGTTGTVSIDRVSGAIFYDTPYLDGSGQPLRDFRDEGYYRAEAERFLKDTGLWREGTVYAGLSKETMVATTPEGKEETRLLSIEAEFASEGLGNVAWAGTGPKLSVFFGEGAIVTGAAAYWPQIEPYREYPTISGRAALENAMAGKGCLLLADSTDEKGMVKAVELVYWCDPVGYPQEFVAPYYKMQGTTADGSPFTLYTRALPPDLVAETLPPAPANPMTPMSR